MYIKQIDVHDFNHVLDLGKDLLNFDNFLVRRNDDFNNELSRFVISSIVEHSTNGYFLETDDGKKIGMIVYSIPNNKKIFTPEQITEHGSEQDLRKYILEKNLSDNEKMIVLKEMDVVNGFNYLSEKYNILIQNKAEINLLYIRPEYRGRYLSKFLFKYFLDDLKMNKCSNFYLFTTTEFNFHFYDKLRMKNLETIIYTKTNCPEFLKYKLILPYKCMLYFGSINEVAF